jgi:hypothetical protein
VQGRCVEGYLRRDSDDWLICCSAGSRRVALKLEPGSHDFDGVWIWVEVSQRAEASVTGLVVCRSRQHARRYGRIDDGPAGGREQA